MNREMRQRLGVNRETIIGAPFEELLTVGSRIFFQTHFYPLIKMQNVVREIYLSFKSPSGSVPVLLNVEVENQGELSEIICGGMEISNRNRFEKELLEAKKAAEDALAENEELVRVKNELLANQHALESQYRKLRSLREQQQELFKLITHDLQEPLRKSVFISNYLLSEIKGLPENITERLHKIVNFNSDMREMLLTLQRYEELDKVTLNYGRINLYEIISEAINAVGLNSRPDVEITYQASNPEFSGDIIRITHLFMELLRHSSKNRNPNNGKLSIEISAMETQKNVFLESADRYQYEKFVKITYVDNGLGFNTDLKRFKIIQKSAQFNKISIGLAFCKRIVEKHHGFMVAKLVKEKGIGYTMFFPLHKA